jgi:ATP-dependent Clp protease protease subunit
MKNNKLKNRNSTKIDVTPWSPRDVTYYGPLTRELCFWGPVNYESSLSIISQLKELEAIDPKSPITLNINTEGGSLSDAYAVYDTLRSIDCPIITIATGMCASAGLALLTAGDYRFASQNTIFFYHQTILDGNSLNSLEASEATHQAYEMCHTLYDRTIIENTKMTLSNWNENFKNRTVKYFDAKEALKYGFIDDIIKNTRFKLIKEKSNGFKR